MIPRPDHPANQQPASRLEVGGGTSPSAGRRLNMLVSHAAWRDSGIAAQLPALLNPVGVHSIVVRSWEEAQRVITQTTIHIAVVDLETPFCCGDSAQVGGVQATESGGTRILQLLRRMGDPLPTVIVRPRQATTRQSARTLCDALREGAFAVLDQPVPLERMLETLRRIVDRHYANAWPAIAQEPTPGRGAMSRLHPFFNTKTHIQSHNKEKRS